MTTPSSEYVSGFVIEPSPPERTSPNLIQLCRENDALVTDLARYAEGICTEAAIRRKYRDVLGDDAWTLLGTDDLLVEMIEAERVRRVRNGSFKRERAQQHITRGPDVLAAIMDDPKANARHRVDSVKALDSLAANGPKDAPEQERIVIKIDLGADLRAKGLPSNPSDILIVDVPANPKPNPNPIDVTPSHSIPDNTINTTDDPIPVRRGPGRPKGSRNKPKPPELPTPSQESDSWKT
jgi:hypothetical protein